jgi:SAM-dependent methyltransferase
MHTQPDTYVNLTTCPACGSGEAASTGPESSGFSVSIEGREFIQPPYVIRECKNCGLLYRSVRLSDPTFEAYYLLKDFRSWEIQGLFPTERVALSVLRSIPSGAAVLDFGCSSGRLLSNLTTTHKCYGMEINVAAAARAAGKGITILPSDALEQGWHASFDAVVLADVFEHLTEPTNLLRKLVSLLKPGGILLLVTGNGDAPACRLDPAQFWYFRIIEHVGMLTRRHATWLERNVGLELQGWKCVSHYDLKWPSTLMQWSRHNVFWQFRLGNKLSRFLLRLIPKVRNAERRTLAPVWVYSADHVVCYFRKL